MTAGERTVETETEEEPPIEVKPMSLLPTKKASFGEKASLEQLHTTIARKTAKQYLADKFALQDENEMDLDELLRELANDAVDERKGKKKWQKLAAVALVFSVVLCCVLFGLMYTANELTKEVKSLKKGNDHAELESPDGTRIRCPSSDLEVDENGALLKYETSEEEKARRLGIEGKEYDAKCLLTGPTLPFGGTCIILGVPRQGLITDQDLVTDPFVFTQKAIDEFEQWANKRPDDFISFVAPVYCDLNIGKESVIYVDMEGCENS